MKHERIRAAGPEADDRWIVLQCGGTSTLRLAKLLQEARFQAWTPVGMVERERPYNRGKVEAQIAITPAFVFAGSQHHVDLAYLSRLPIKPFPDFSIMTVEIEPARVRDSSLASLRDEEERQQAESQERLRKTAEAAERAAELAEAIRISNEQDLVKAQDRERRRVVLEQEAAERRARRSIRRRFLPGQPVRVSKRPFTDYVGVVETSDGRSTGINFGGRFRVTFDACDVFAEAV